MHMFGSHRHVTTRPAQAPAAGHAPFLCRGAVQGEGLSSPEQFGVWEVEGVGLVVAFRGTASAEDVLVDVNIRPAPLATARNMRGATHCVSLPICILATIVFR
jgi:hypothetical protein